MDPGTKNVPDLSADRVQVVVAEPSTGTAAGRSLVVLDPEAASTTLRALLQHPDASDGALDLLVVFPTAEYEARRRARRAAGVTAPYTIDHLEAEARRVAEAAGREWLDPAGVAFEPIGAVGRVRDSVQAVVDDRGSTRIYVAATRPTLWQRLRGVTDRSTALAGVLPTVVPVVAIDLAIELASTVADGDALSELPADVDGSTGRDVDLD